MNATPPITVQSTVVYADAVVCSAWRNDSGVHAVLALSDGRGINVWIPRINRLPVEYRGGAAAAVAALDTWTDNDQAPLSKRHLIFERSRSHASVQLIRTAGGVVLAWLKRRVVGP